MADNTTPPSLTTPDSNSDDKNHAESHQGVSDILEQKLKQAGVIVKSQVSADEKRLTVWSLIYDFFILTIIILNLTMLGLDYLLMGHAGHFLASLAGLSTALEIYRSVWHNEVATIDQWTTLLLIIELLLRWAIAIYRKQYHRWFFFPFAHWYETLGCIPTFRALRLLRVVVIGYKLYQIGINLVPQSILRSGKFYYNLVLEELSDRIIIHVLGTAEKELKSSNAYASIVGNLINKYRTPFATALTEIIQTNIAPVLHANEANIRQGIGNAVQNALHNTKEIDTLIRLVPMVGKKIDALVQQIAYQLGANISSAVIQKIASQDTSPNAFAQQLSSQISQLKFDSPALTQLIESLVFEGINIIRTQIAVQQWKAEETIKKNA